MRILVVAKDLPYPPVDGYRLVTFHMLRGLSGRCHFDLLAFGNDTDSVQWERARPYLDEVRVVPRPELSGWALSWARIRARFSGLPSDVLRNLGAPMQNAIAQAMAKREYDLIYFNAPALAWYARSTYPVKPTVLAPLDSRTRQLPALAKTVRNPALKVQAWEQHQRSRAFERRYYSYADACVVVSEQDRATLMAVNPGIRVQVVPLGVDADHFRPDRYRAPRYDLAFSGNLAYDPNREAARSLVNAILPAVRQRVPHARIAIIGAHPAESLMRAGKADPDLVVTGYVNDVAEHLSQAKVFVCPVRSGSGMRVKIMEAMSAGLPVVTYRVNIEGLPVRHNEHLLIAEDQDQLAACAVQLLHDSEQRERLGKNARELMRRSFSWTASNEMLHKVLRSAAAAGRRRLNSSGLADGDTRIYD